jgi:hypothetical protein
MSTESSIPLPLQSSMTVVELAAEAGARRPTRHVSVVRTRIMVGAGVGGNTADEQALARPYLQVRPGAASGQETRIDQGRGALPRRAALLSRRSEAGLPGASRPPARTAVPAHPGVTHGARRGHKKTEESRPSATLPGLLAHEVLATARSSPRERSSGCRRSSTVHPDCGTSAGSSRSRGQRCRPDRRLRGRASKCPWRPT